jgi:hypothetical protein
MPAIVTSRKSHHLDLLADLLQVSLEVFVDSVLVNEEDLHMQLESACKNKTLRVVMQRSTQSLGSTLVSLLYQS